MDITVIINKLLDLLDHIKNDSKELEVLIKDLLKRGYATAYDTKLLIKISDLELSVRAVKSCINNDLVYVGDLVQLSVNEFLRLPNVGKKTLDEIILVLNQLGFSFGMIIPFWDKVEKEEMRRILKNKELI